MSTKYETNGALKLATLDSFNSGEYGKTQHSWFDYPMVASSLTQIKGSICDLLGCEENAILVNSCDEPGRIDVQVMENGNGDAPSENEFSEWKAGRIDLYSVTYSFQFESVTRVPALFEGV